MKQLQLQHILQTHQGEFHSVVPFSPELDKLLLLDFTINNSELTDDLINDTNAYTNYINNKLKEANARYGIGGYNEHRIVYSRSSVFNPKTTEEEPRRLHIGVDVWGKPYTKVMSPLDGIIHSFGFHNEVGNYGAVLILTHHLEGLGFHTLYGHLSRNSIVNTREGERVKKGDVVGEFGIASENGSWPPHLHFQIISDMGEFHGDYPGVCKFSQREQWLSACPDPDLILQLNKFI
ncbi:MAG TPA: peptidoglycan DD-metalloendopeptidase family protein [Chitinophagaceae bacterium]|mgnify:CR=1 FL=1|nr:peptidoglycan DD-metalloendopeptidase family protein [Chitinophagaceae bacterium]